jgi:hypothetical protein
MKRRPPRPDGAAAPRPDDAAGSRPDAAKADARDPIRSSPSDATGSGLSDATGSSISDPPEPRPTDAAAPDPWAESSMVGGAELDPWDQSKVSGAARLDPWGEPVNTEQVPRFKWRADATAREEAARFAVWGGNSTNETPDQPVLSGGSANSSQAIPVDAGNDDSEAGVAASTEPSVAPASR